MSEKDVLEQVRRASAAAPLAAEPSRSLAQQPVGWLTFRLGEEEYGIDILTVREIRGYETPARIANAPAVVKGVVNLRGAIVPIVDLRIRLGLERANCDSSTVTMILNMGGRLVGAVVDSVSDVVNLQSGQIKPAPEFNRAVSADFVTGIAVLEYGGERRVLILIDIEALMSGDKVSLACAAES